MLYTLNQCRISPTSHTQAPKQHIVTSPPIEDSSTPTPQPIPSTTVRALPTKVPSVKNIQPTVATKITQQVPAEPDSLKTSKTLTDDALVLINEDIDHTPDYSRDYLLHSDCPIRECIKMSFDLKNSKRAQLHQKPNSDGTIQYTFKIRAKHNKYRNIKQLNVVYIGQADTQPCTEFGSNGIAVLGYTSSHQPIVISHQGPIVLHDKNLIIGQPGGLRVFRNQKLIQRVNAPYPSFSSYGVQERSFHLNPHGYLFFKKTLENICLAYSASNPFQSANPENCGHALEKDPNHSIKFEQNAKYHAFRPANNDSNYRVDVYQRHCPKNN